MMFVEGMFDVPNPELSGSVDVLYYLQLAGSGGSGMLSMATNFTEWSSDRQASKR